MPSRQPICSLSQPAWTREAATSTQLLTCSIAHQVWPAIRLAVRAAVACMMDRSGMHDVHIRSSVHPLQAFPGRPAPSNAFQPTGAADDTANVTTAEELVQALQQARRHIVITRHLDLTGLEPLNFEEDRVDREPLILGAIPDATHSITVRSHSVRGKLSPW